MNIEKILKPKSIVVVGASDKVGSFARQAAENVRLNKNVPYFYVNPRREECLGEKCYPSISELPQKVEAAIICTPKITVLDLVKEAAANGVKTVAIFASGFNEVEGGWALEKEIIDIANENDMGIIGPNCIGVQNCVDLVNLWTMGAPRYWGERPFGVASVAHSGSITGSLLIKKSIPASYAASIGNGNQATMEHFMEYFADDINVKYIASYCEGIKEPEVLESALRKAYKNDKPVIILKSGRSKESAKCAKYHTGWRSENGAGNIEEFKAIFKKFNVVRTIGIMEYQETVAAFVALNGKYPKNSGVAGFAGSGGQTTVNCDLAIHYGLKMPQMSKEDWAEMDAMLPEIATANNPLDTTTEFRGDKKDLMKLLTKNPEIGFLYLLQSPPNKLTDKNGNDTIAPIREIKTAIGEDKILCFAPNGMNTTNPEVLEALQKIGGIISLPGSQMNFMIMGHIAKFIDNKKIKIIPYLSIAKRTGKEVFSDVSAADAAAKVASMGLKAAVGTVADSLAYSVSIKEYAQFGHMVTIEKTTYEVVNGEIVKSAPSFNYIYPAPMNADEATEFMRECDVNTNKALADAIAKISDYVYKNKQDITSLTVDFAVTANDAQVIGSTFRTLQ